MKDGKAGSRLTKQKLQELKDLGYQYVLVKGYSAERSANFIELNHFTLLPVKQLPEDPNEKDIFAPIDSEILLEWASSGDDGIEAFIEKVPK